MVALTRLCMAGLACCGWFPHRLTHSTRDGRCGGITAQLGGPENDWEYEMAPPSELALHIPSWAADIMLDEAQNKEYTRSQRESLAAAYAPVEGREWVGEESQGIAAFTPREIAEDFNTPTESVLAKMLEAGVPERDVKPDRPICETCSAAQVCAGPRRWALMLRAGPGARMCPTVPHRSRSWRRPGRTLMSRAVLPPAGDRARPLHAVL
jgi:hypothetical protein